MNYEINPAWFFPKGNKVKNKCLLWNLKVPQVFFFCQAVGWTFIFRNAIYCVFWSLNSLFRLAVCFTPETWIKCAWHCVYIWLKHKSSKNSSFTRLYITEVDDRLLQNIPHRVYFTCVDIQTSNIKHDWWFFTPDESTPEIDCADASGLTSVPRAAHLRTSAFDKQINSLQYT